jgi:hypothetical protein
MSGLLGEVWINSFRDLGGGIGRVGVMASCCKSVWCLRWGFVGMWDWVLDLGCAGLLWACDFRGDVVLRQD